jgi:hypothetical protein
MANDATHAVKDQKSEQQGKAPEAPQKDLIHHVQELAQASERSVSVPAAKLTAERVGEKWEAAAQGPKDQQAAAFGAINKDITKLANDALKNAKTPEERTNAIHDLEGSINSPIKMFGGPMIRINDSGSLMQITHLREATEAETKGKSPQELKAAGFLPADVGSNGDNSKKTWAASIIEPTVVKLEGGAERPQAGPGAAAESTPTKEPYSTDVSAVAFNALKQKTGVDLIGADKWDAKTPEQKWWAKGMADSARALASGDLPSNVQIKAEAAKGVGGADIVNKAVGSKLEDSGDPQSVYMAGSIAKADDWFGKAKHMPVKDAAGNPVTENGQPKVVDSVYKQGKVYDVDGTKVFEIFGEQGKGKTYAVENPGNLPDGMSVSEYAQKMIDKATKSQGVATAIEFPMYEKKVQQDMTGIVGMSVKNSDMVIAQAKMDAIWAANQSGKFSFERQAFEVATRSLQMNEDPPAVRLDKPFIVAEATDKGRAYMSATINLQDMKRPDIEKLKKEAGYK